MHIIIIWPTITHLFLNYKILHVADFTGPSTGRITLHLVHYLFTLCTFYVPCCCCCCCCNR